MNRVQQNHPFLEKDEQPRNKRSLQGRLRVEDGNTDKEVVVGEGVIELFPLNEANQNPATYGVMFDIKAKKTLAITNYAFFTKESTIVEFNLYTKKGSYKFSKSSLFQWTLIGNGNIESNGIYEPTRVDKMDTVFIPEDKIQGFYLTLNTSILVYSTSEEALESDEAELRLGSAVRTNPPETSFFEPRSWCGQIGYFIIDYISSAPSLPPSSAPMTFIPTKLPSRKPSLSPTIKVSDSPSASATNSPTFITSRPSRLPTPIPTRSPTKTVQLLQTNQTFTFYGTTLDFLDSATDEGFRDEVKDTLQQDLNQKYQNIKVTHMVTKNQLMLGDNFLEIASSIHSKYTSQSSIDFTSIIKTSIDKTRQQILTKMKSKYPSQFENVQRLDSIPTPNDEFKYKVAVVNRSIPLYGKGLSRKMDSTTVINFENMVRDFFNQSLSSLHENAFVVMAIVEGQKYYEEENVLEIWVLLQTKCKPTPSFDMFLAIQSIIDESGHLLFIELKSSNFYFFSRLESVFPENFLSESFITLAPIENSNDEEIDDNSILDFLTSTIGYIVIGVCGFLLLVLIICCFCLCCNYNDDDDVSEIIKGILNDEFTTSTTSLVNVSKRRLMNSNILPLLI